MIMPVAHRREVGSSDQWTLVQVNSVSIFTITCMFTPRTQQSPHIQWHLYLSFPDNSFSRIRRSISMVPERILWLPHLLFSRIHCFFFRPQWKRWIEVSLYFQLIDCVAVPQVAEGRFCSCSVRWFCVLSQKMLWDVFYWTSKCRSRNNSMSCRYQVLGWVGISSWQNCLWITITLLIFELTSSRCEVKLLAHFMLQPPNDFQGLKKKN
jgi:hypothetical protein